MTNGQLAVQFFLQMAVILSACRVVGRIGRPLGQPQVVAEMITGILLGPSFLGSVWPEIPQWLFPWDPNQTMRDTQSYLYPVSQLGLALYMFVVGLEFRTEFVWKYLRSSLAVSVAGMVAPFFLGGFVAWILHARTNLFPEGTPLSSAVLFLGASLCITAFPMLARILDAKGLSGSHIGTIAIGAAAIGDVTAWCLMAVVLATIEGNPSLAVRNIVGGFGFTVFAIFCVRPLWNTVSHWFLSANQKLHETGFACSLVLMLLGALGTELLGLHSIFGAFIVGVIAPRGPIKTALIQKLSLRIQA
jgi:Kef-type K+ transport system membrane component KefB